MGIEHCRRSGLCGERRTDAHACGRTYAAGPAKYACRTRERTGADEVAGIIQAPAPPRLIEGGLPTERLVVDVVLSKYAELVPWAYAARRP
jgi:transposase